MLADDLSLSFGLHPTVYCVDIFEALLATLSQQEDGESDWFIPVRFEAAVRQRLLHASRNNATVWVQDDGAWELAVIGKLHCK